MRKLLVFLLLLSLPFICFGGPPTRTYTYSTGEVIDATKVTTNEDNLYNYLAGGVDTFKDGSIVSADIQDGTIANADIATSAEIADSKLANITTAGKVNGTAITGLGSIPSGAGTIPAANLGGVTLPSGAVFFMISGSCPSGTTDVTATYADRMIIANATQNATGGSATHLHTGPSHTHSVTVPYNGYSTSAGVPAGNLASRPTQDPDSSTGVSSDRSLTSGSGGTGNTGSTSSYAPYITCKMCRVN